MQSPLLAVALLCLFGVLVQGYHLGTDDAEIYLPAIKQVVHPGLYPFGSAFFLAHAHLSHLAFVVGNACRLLHLTPDVTILLFHVLSFALLMASAWQLAACLFVHKRALWSAVAVLACVVSVPVAGTALCIADPFLTARSLSTPLTLFALASFLNRRYLPAVAWLLLAGFVHPQMVVYVAGLMAFLLLEPAFSRAAARAVPVRAAVALASPLLGTFSLQPATGDYRQVLYTRTFFFMGQWAWWEWSGVVLPLALLFWLSRQPVAGTRATMLRLCSALVGFGLFSTAVALLLSSSTRFDSLTRLQPMRSFHLVYICMFLMLGGLLGEHVLRLRPVRWLLCFVPLAGGMLWLNLSQYPNSPHLELPGLTPRNAWVQGFLWIRDNTPTDAIFAIDPRYLERPGNDQHGFRAIAERSVLSDYFKDSGAVTMFPQLLPEWKQEQAAQAGWQHFGPQDFTRLQQQFGVSWVVLEHPVAGMQCPFRNQAILVCKV
ncbi:hypothetical protein [Acidipila sp. EB88]|uniref:hypothetical protein n=1 Tax=Acidipila sp. EB88 TaxID=2305226 RepID=UPI000F5DEA78|nr:hypothetical protein [Acidipila sp. EB88]RRA47553.1 hypothetical protein D1Y84_03815 [Acidipila sp. EB88]